MLRVADEAYKSDTGRERHANEDSYFARAPVFMVADGMGGAQAGEVASQIAADAFQPQISETLAPEEALREIVQAANRKIHELAAADTARAGMGTTLTAALLAEEEISFAHVGDSRAYLLRDGRLRQLTQDHSLVEELRRQGRLTEAQAEEHPQRSIITRALGPESDVEVDTMTFRTRPGDVFLLCSDGLTTMVTEERITAILTGAATLGEAVEELVEAANDAGGRDNVTVVAFRLEGVPGTVAEPDELEEATLAGAAAEEAGLTAEGVRRAAEEERARSPAGRPVPVPPPRPIARPGAAPRPWGRRVLTPLIAMLALAALVVVAIIGMRQVYFLGADEDGRVALYRGLPYELPLGIDLYEERYAGPVPVRGLPPKQRRSATDHELRSRDDAVSLIREIERSRGFRQ